MPRHPSGSETPVGEGLTDRAPIDSRDCLTLPDGKILVAGVGEKGHHALARLLPDGSVDTRFGVDGVAEGPALGDESGSEALALQPDGKIVSVGEVWRDDIGGYDPIIVRHDEGGRPDAEFGRGGLVVTPVGCSATFKEVALQPDGKIVAGGSAEGETGVILVRYERNGALDSSFGTGGIVRLSA